MRTGALVAVALVVLIVAGCATGQEPLPSPIAGWPVQTIRVDDRELRVVLAVDSQQGLQGVDDLGELDGMLFDFVEEVEPGPHGFWMRDVTIELDIAWFDGGGVLIDTMRMPVCAVDCPTFRAAAPFRWALETPAGSLALTTGARLEVVGPADTGTSFVPSVP